MKYISKGLVVEGSTEHILKIQRGGYEFQLTGDRARLWLNGRFGVADADGTNPRYVKELLHLKRVGLTEPVGEEPEGVYRAMTQCVLVPAKAGRLRAPLNPLESQTLQWLREAGLRLTMAELVCQRAGGADGARILPGGNGACRAGLAEEKEDRPALIHTGRWIVPFQPPVRSFG